MDTRRYSKFFSGLGTSLILFSLLVNSAIAAAPSNKANKAERYSPSNSDVMQKSKQFFLTDPQSASMRTDLLQFTLGGHALGSVANSMEATTSSLSLRGGFPGKTAGVPLYLRTGIFNIDVFLETCPTNDPIYAKLRNDFTIRIDGVIVGDIPCSEPISSMPITQYTEQLISLQTIRAVYYIDPGISNFLPWTSMNLYDWMTSKVSGINLKTASGQYYCCDQIDGKIYIARSIGDDNYRELLRKWDGYYTMINFFAHEIRHADINSPGHVTGCAAFPDPNGPLGCDADYDLSNLGSYGVGYWLTQSWLTGYLNVGISCAPDGGLAYAQKLLSAVNKMRNRFVQNIPPVAVIPDPPYGGPCIMPMTISGNTSEADTTLNYTDGPPKTATSDSSGNYSLTVGSNWSGTVTPSKIGYTFSPVDRPYTNILANQTGQNYTASQDTYWIFLPMVVR
jgi:hypothetical protein